MTQRLELPALRQKDLLELGVVLSTAGTSHQMHLRSPSLTRLMGQGGN